VFNSTLRDVSGDGFSMVIVNTRPPVHSSEPDGFQTSDVANVSDPQTDKVFFNRV
jgi:hypothetical protein